MPQRPLPALLLGASALLTACGGAPETERPKGPDPCVAGKAHLEQRLGPELSRFVTTAPLPPARGCALVYLRVAEEMPEEMPDGDDLKMDTDHELAFAFVKGSGVNVDQIPRSAMAPGPVVMKLANKDITGDGVPDLVVEEKQGEFGMTKYRGLRIFDWSRGTGREVFSEKLEVTTPEGLTIVPTWTVGTADGKRAIKFDGAGTSKVFAWEKSQGRFVHVASQTPEAPKPAAEAPPAAPIPAETTEAQPAEKDGSNVLEDLGL